MLVHTETWGVDLKEVPSTVSNLSLSSNIIFGYIQSLIPYLQTEGTLYALLFI